MNSVTKTVVIRDDIGVEEPKVALNPQYAHPRALSDWQDDEDEEYAQNENTTVNTPDSTPMIVSLNGQK